MLTIDTEKAYDTVPYALIELMLYTYKCPAHIVNLIMQMHQKRALHFKLNGVIGEALTPEKGVAPAASSSCSACSLSSSASAHKRQGCGAGR